MAKFTESSEDYKVKDIGQAPKGDIQVTARGGGAAQKGLKATWTGGSERTKGPCTDDVN